MTSTDLSLIRGIQRLFKGTILPRNFYNIKKAEIFWETVNLFHSSIVSYSVFFYSKVDFSHFIHKIWRLLVKKKKGHLKISV